MTDGSQYDGVSRKIEIAHEKWLKEQDLRLSQVEADKQVLLAKEETKREVTKTRYENDNWSIIRVVSWVAILAIFITASITYCGVAPVDPVKEETEQEKYALCMQYEKDHERCTS